VGTVVAIRETGMTLVRLAFMT